MVKAEFLPQVRDNSSESWQKNFIEEMRREKFSIGSLSKNPLAAELHRALTNLSTELYQNDMHFMKELIQNAEDNSYGEHVRPSLKFVLTNEDVAGVGASKTLLVLNNEAGLTRSDVEALCSVRQSTKTGKRDVGYIGCKGIGFKSVFMVCQTPIFISNGFRIRFHDEPSKEAGVGYIVPEWTETPTNDDIQAVCGLDSIPATVIVLPLRHDKVGLVRRQLKEISPENILFLSKIRELQVVFKRGAHVVDSLNIIRSEPIYSTASEFFPHGSSGGKVTFKFFKVSVSVRCELRSDAFPYLVFQALFPVTHPIAEREEIHEWAISLAFPEAGRASDQAGDIFSFLPTEQRTGFPFIINADFILTSSRETIKFDNTWNIGILDCIPAAFQAAFSKLINSTIYGKSLRQRRDVYKFLPVNAVQDSYRYSSAGSGENRRVRQKIHVQPQQASNIHQLEMVRAEIFRRVRLRKHIFLSVDVDQGLHLSKYYGLPAQSCFLIKSAFREILGSAARHNHPAPSTVLIPAEKRSDGLPSSKRKMAIVDEFVQDNYSSALKAFGVCEMTLAQYESFLLNVNWFVNVPDAIYVQILIFFSREWKHLSHTYADKFDLLKTRVETGGVELTSFPGLGQSELLYTSSIADAEWIYAWVKEFNAWDPVKVVPANTSQALIAASDSVELLTWVGKHVSLTEVSVRKYALRLVEKLVGPKRTDRHATDPKFSVLVLQFLYSAIRDKKLSREIAVHMIRHRRNVFVLDGKTSREQSLSCRIREEAGILLPAAVSKWANLFTCSCVNSKHLITLSDTYLDPQSSLVREFVTKSPGPDSMLEFIKDAFDAVDLPLVKLPADAIISFRCPTMERSVLMLQWLKEFLPKRKRTSFEYEKDNFLRNVAKLPWVKTYHHGWQVPSSVFCSTDYFEDWFTSHDLPFLDVPAYGNLDHKDAVTQFVLQELRLVTCVTNPEGAAAVVNYLSKCSATILDLAAVGRFYKYLHEFASHDQILGVKVWIPAGATSEEPVWKDPAECITSDETGIFRDSSYVTVLDSIYCVSLVPFFSKLQVPEKASGVVYCNIWCEWSRMSPSLDKVKEEHDCAQNAVLITRAKALHVLKAILHCWQEKREEATEDEDEEEEEEDDAEGQEHEGEDTVAEEDKVGKEDADKEEKEKSVEDIAAGAAAVAEAAEPANEEDEFWNSFHSRAWIPVAPSINEPITDASTIAIVPPSQVLIADDLELSKGFSAVANEELKFVWLPPGLSSEESEILVKLYTTTGVRKLSELITCNVGVPPDVWTKKVSRGKGLICEGLFRAVLAYLCKKGEEHGLTLESRQQILSPLISATEIEVEEHLEKTLSLHVGTSTYSATKQNVFAHYDSLKTEFYRLKKGHPVLRRDKKKFNSQVVTTLSSGILSEHPELIQGLADFLLPLCQSGFSAKSVKSKLQRQKFLIFTDDEKLLMESISTKIKD